MTREKVRQRVPLAPDATVREGISSAAAEDPVELAADHSFPASDPPSWTGVHAGAKDSPRPAERK